MEIRLKPLAGAALMLALAGAIAFGVVAVVQGSAIPFGAAGSPPVPPIGPDLSPSIFPTPTPTPYPVELVPGDESARWDWTWQSACLPNLEKFFGQFPAHKITITLTDNPTLSLGVAYPEMGEAQSIGLTRCEEIEDELRCQVSVGKGATGPALDTALTAAAIYGVQEFFRSHVRQDWENRSAWSWTQFEPFLAQEEGTWRSQCVTATGS